MNATQVTDRTRMFARVLGPFLDIVPLAAALHAPQMHALLADFGANPLWPWVVGAFVLLLGLVVVALHTSWSGPAAVIVSAVGWLMVLRGVLLLTFPAVFMTAADAVIGTNLVWRVGYLLLALVGLYLSYVGWRPVADRAPVQVR
jgi:hypothetical protein